MIEGVSFSLSIVPAAISAFFLSVVYVSSLYLWPQEHNRNHPTVIKRRVISALLVTALSPLYVWVLSSTRATSVPRYTMLEWLGFRDPASALLPVALTVLLFLGPLLQSTLDGQGVLSEYKSFRDPLFLRNIVFAPFTEEAVFRGCMAPLLAPAFGWTPTIFFLPLYFGVAHLHHGYELYSAGKSWKVVILMPLIQTSYTSLFGMYSTLVFLVTGSLAGSVLCHVFCNCMGLPDFGAVPSSTHPRVIALAYVVGLVGFIYVLPSVLACHNFDSLYCRL